MEHRDKRQRFNESEHPVCNPDTKIPSTESVLAPSTTTEGSVAPVPTARGSASPVPEGLVVAISKTSVAPISGVPEPTSQTVEEPSTPLTSDTIRTSDTSTWQGWAEIENDPVRPLTLTVGYTIRSSSRLGVYPSR